MRLDQSIETAIYFVSQVPRTRLARAFTMEHGL